MRRLNLFKKNAFLTTAILAVIFSAVIMLIYAGGYMWLKESTCNKISTLYIENSLPIKNKIGRVDAIDLEIFGSEFELRGERGSAIVTYDLRGSLKSGTIKFTCEKLGGAWEIKTVNMNVNGESEILSLE